MTKQKNNPYTRAKSRGENYRQRTSINKDIKKDIFSMKKLILSYIFVVGFFSVFPSTQSLAQNTNPYDVFLLCSSDLEISEENFNRFTGYWLHGWDGKNRKRLLTLGATESICSELEKELIKSINEHESYLAFRDKRDKEIENERKSNYLNSVIELVSNNDINATFELARLYYTGEIVEQNTEKAIFYYYKAASSGHIMSKQHLGYINYLNRNYHEAIRWFSEASKSGDYVSLQNFEYLTSLGKNEYEIFFQDTLKTTNCAENYPFQRETVLSANSGSVIFKDRYGSFSVTHRTSDPTSIISTEMPFQITQSLVSLASERGYNLTSEIGSSFLKWFITQLDLAREKCFEGQDCTYLPVKTICYLNELHINQRNDDLHFLFIGFIDNL